MTRLLSSSSSMDADLIFEATKLRNSMLAEVVQLASEPGPQKYAPRAVTCPRLRPRIRIGSTLSSQEKAWVQRRQRETARHLRDLFSRISIPDFNSNNYIKQSESSRALPVIGIACSGGGYRAMLNGAGVLASWDSRSEGSRQRSGLGGLLQSATYISGLSGGGWLVGSEFKRPAVA
ncbi:hypothetical protein HIM_08476 [Hirsutella minnesotensis 3608]|uniref:Lysophospholipase n=1 Tax=Hirsutella minnesotensis 3608 TaxID=1043627 RepID=A0A0F7ZSX1_9HYPO|nr:hypothetical protein HIM_08476 [Hirsutella minnesotensis 3608]